MMNQPMTISDIKTEIMNHPLAGDVLKPLMDEHRKLETILNTLKGIFGHFERCHTCDHCPGYQETLLKGLALLKDVELHHAREEYILHREIERQGIFGTQGELHENYLILKEKLPELIKACQWSALPFPKLLIQQGQDFIQRYLQLVIDEELSLYTTAIDIIQDKAAWERIRQGFEEIGYCPLDFEKEDEMAYWDRFSQAL